MIVNHVIEMEERGQNHSNANLLGFMKPIVFRVVLLDFIERIEKVWRFKRALDVYTLAWIDAPVPGSTIVRDVEITKIKNNLTEWRLGYAPDTRKLHQYTLLSTKLGIEANVIEDVTKRFEAVVSDVESLIQQL